MPKKATKRTVTSKSSSNKAKASPRKKKKSSFEDDLRSLQKTFASARKTASARLAAARTKRRQRGIVRQKTKALNRRLAQEDQPARRFARELIKMGHPPKKAIDAARVLAEEPLPVVTHSFRAIQLGKEPMTTAIRQARILNARGDLTPRGRKRR